MKSGPSNLLRARFPMCSRQSTLGGLAGSHIKLFTLNFFIKKHFLTMPVSKGHKPKISNDVHAIDESSNG
jgi:hypothetical protein